MPIASGFEVLHELRAAEETRHIAVIAVSGHDRGIALAKENPDFFAVVAKPFDIEALVRIIHRALHQVHF